MTKISPARDDVAERAAQRKVLDRLLSPLAVQTGKLPICPQAGLSSFQSLDAAPRTRLGLEAVRSETIASPLTMFAGPSNAVIEMPSVHSMFLFERVFDEFLR